MTQKNLFVPKIIALVLVVSCLSSVTTSAFATGFRTFDLDFSLNDTVTFRMVEKSLEDPELQALFVKAVARQVLNETSSYGYGNLDTSVPAYIYVDRTEASVINIGHEYIDVYYRYCIGKSLTPDSYVFVRIYNPVIKGEYANTIITAFSNVNYIAGDFLSVSDPYETPEQMTAYLDTLGYPYYTVSPESLAEAQAALNDN